MDLGLELTDRDGLSVLAVSGEVDVATVPRLREQLHSLVAQGLLTEEQAVETLRAGQRRYGGCEGAVGDRLVLWAKRLASLSGASFLAWIVLHVAR